nr:MAG: carbamoyl phosphate synthase [Bacteroidota bacterium]
MGQKARLELNVLFTSVGRRVELMRAFRDAYSRLEICGHIVATDIDPLAPALQVVDRPYMVPPLTDSRYIPTLIEICRREKIDLVFPLIDPDIPVLAAHRKEIEATGAKLVVVSTHAAKIAADKWRTMAFFQSLGLPTPKSWLPDQVSVEDLQFPVFIKPRRGSAAKHAFKVDNPDALRFFISYVPDPIIQEYLSGPEVTNDIICNLKGDVLGVASRKRIEVRWGEVAKGVTIRDQTILDACVRIARALPAVGPITVQCIWKDGVPHFTEINARMGGGLPLAIAAGVDAPLWLLADAAGLKVDIPPLGTYREGLYMTRFDDSFFLEEKDYEKMDSHRV